MTRFVDRNRIASVTDGEMTEFKRNLGLHGLTADDVRMFNKDPHLMTAWVENARKLFADEWYVPIESCPTHEWRPIPERAPHKFRLTRKIHQYDLDVLEIEMWNWDDDPVKHILEVDHWTTVAEGVQMRKKYPHHLNIEIRLQRQLVKN